MDPLTELTHLLRPAGGGIHVVSTGRAEQEALQRSLYGDVDIDAAWRASLQKIARAKVILLGVPSDVGAGYRRGAAFGPQEVRRTLGRPWGDDVLDLGDVRVVPQLLHDTMLTEAQLADSRSALFPGISEPLPVSPLSIEERVLDLVHGLNPDAVPFVLGGDHSCAWPVASMLARTRRDPWAIVQLDAHTDLLPHRLGVKYCFATWSFHANELLGRGGKLVQLGIRASGKPKAHWESTLGVKQFWADECRGDHEAVFAHLHSLGIRDVYLSNDIDGTDAHWADATGTPEPNGLTPEWVTALIERIGREFRIIAADVMEVAPPIASSPQALERTLHLAAGYLRTSIDAILGSRT